MPAGNHRLKIFDWNILAPIWTNKDEYVERNGDINLLHEEKRLLLVIDRILESGADIITLQEVQEDHYKVLCEELRDKYDTLGHTQHDIKYWTEWLADDVVVLKNGQTTFVRKGMFKTIEKQEFKTSEDGNMCQIVVLQFNRTNKFILVNCHLESGMIEWKHETRAKQVSKIHEEILLKMQKYSDGKKTDSIPVIFLGDFNTYGDQLGMKEVRKYGYVDVEEMSGDSSRPTFIIVPVLEDQEEGIQLDHICLLHSQVKSGMISVNKFVVPDLASSEYDSVNHHPTIVKAFFKRRKIPPEQALLDPAYLDILTRIAPSPENFTESNPLRALRIGSDHLPLYAELDINFF